MTDKTYYLVTVDTEEEWNWSAGWPVRDSDVTNLRLLPRFQRLCERYDVKPTYFCNLAVVENAKSRQILADIASSDQVEIGMHIHPWNTPPLTGDMPAPRSTFLHNLPPEVIRAKFAAVYDALARFGVRPTSFRGGRYSSGGVIHECLRQRKFLADCSVVPYTRWPEDGAPDYHDRDLMPCRLPPTARGDTPLWELPLTLAFSRRPFRLWQRCFETIESTMLSRLRLIGLAERLGLVRRIWLNFEIGPPQGWLAFWRLIRRLQVPYICLTVHSSSLAAGPGPYTRSDQDEERIFQNIESVFAALRGEPNFVPMTASDLARHLEQHYARTGN
jgi:hypothetical protein